MQFANSAALNSTICSWANNHGIFISSNADTNPWYTVDLQYNSTVSAVQLWYRADTPSLFLSPLVVFVTAFQPYITVGGSGTNAVSAALTPCATLIGAVAGGYVTLPFATPCTGRYVTVQTITGGTYFFSGTNFMQLCALLVFGTPSVASFSSLLALPNIAYSAPAARASSAQARPVAAKTPPGAANIPLACASPSPPCPQMASSLSPGANASSPTRFQNASSLTQAACAWTTGMFASAGVSGTSESYPWYQVRSRPGGGAPSVAPMQYRVQRQQPRDRSERPSTFRAG